MRDAALLHAINLQRYSNSEVRAMLRVLNGADVELAARLAAALERLPVESFTVRRLDALLSGVWDMNDRLYRQLSLRTAQEMEQLAGVELNTLSATFTELLPAGQVTVGVPSTRQVWAAATARPFRGRLMADWFSTLAAQRQARIEVALRTGYVTGQTVDEMVRTVRGTRAEGYADGIINIDRRNAEAVVRTAVSHTAEVARQAFYAENRDLIKEEQWLSTLDNRTTDLCIARDGKLYTADDAHEPIGHDLPWLEGPGQIHWNCRSVSIPVINTAKVLGFELPPVERAAMNGVAAPGTTYKEWLASQPASVQDQILGKKRGALYRAGDVSFGQFFNSRGEFKTLAQLGD
jgi:SPP1 gp7 family putative phage head morphogenesis protein